MNQRHSLFVEDGCAGNWTTESGEPLVFRGHESLRRLAEWLERCFPDWEWHNVRIFETEDPNHFWVECDGRGKALVPGYPEGYCENHYIHSFELENGRIKRVLDRPAGRRAAGAGVAVRSAASGPAEPSWRAVGFRATTGTGRGRESLGPA